MRRACQRGDGRERRIAGEFGDQAGERAVDVRQCAGGAKAVEQIERFQVLQERPPKQASMASMQAAEGASWNTPWPGWAAVMPRTNR